MHCPLEPHTPFRQLHDVELLVVATRQRPLPEIPSSHVAHPAGHAWQLGPKKPEAQDSQELPVNPGGQLHVPAAEQMPAPEHGGEQADDWMSSRDTPLIAKPDGNCDKSAIESHRMSRSLDEEPDATATQTLDDRTRDPAAVVVESREALLEGSAVNVDAPE